MIYATAMCFLAPRMLISRDWNNETRGDILEGVMGFYYERSHTKHVDDDVLEQARDVSLIIERTSWLTYTLYHCLLAGAAFQDCCRQIITRAAHLKGLAEADRVASRILLEEPEFLVGPRKKPSLRFKIEDVQDVPEVD